MYQEHSFENKYSVNRITLTKKIHCYCRLGGDWYTNQLEISFYPQKEIPDYVYLDKAIEERCEQKDLIIEEVVNEIYKIILEQCPTAANIQISSYVDDSVPKNMQVKVEKWGGYEF